MKQYVFKLPHGEWSRVEASSINRAIVTLKWKLNNEFEARCAQLKWINKCTL